MANQIGVSLTNSKALIILILLFVVASFAVTRSISPNAAPNYNWASPREADEAWMDLHLLLKNTVQHAAENDGLQLIFYGDSITEVWDVECGMLSALLHYNHTPLPRTLVDAGHIHGAIHQHRCPTRVWQVLSWALQNRSPGHCR